MGKNKSLISRLLFVVLCVNLVFSFGITVSVAAELPEASAVSEDNTVISPRAEETQWVYRINNGYREMRLWSITQGKWLTDWIVIGPAT